MQKATELGSQIYEQFKTILRFSYTHETYERNKIKIQTSETENNNLHKNRKNNNIGYHRIIPKANRLIHLTEKKNCQKCNESIKLLDKRVEKTVIDLVFTQTGVRKTIIKYWGMKTYCQSCNCRYNPEGINKNGGNKLFGHAFQSWVVYQRLVLRLSYNNIVKLMEEQFNERVSLTTITEFIKSFAYHYSDTENALLEPVTLPLLPVNFFQTILHTCI